LPVSGGDALDKGLLSNKIQEEEAIGLIDGKLQKKMEMGNICVDFDGKHVNVGNFDSQGLNVNNNWDDNRNDILGLASARQYNLQNRIILSNIREYYS